MMRNPQITALTTIHLVMKSVLVSIWNTHTDVTVPMKLELCSSQTLLSSPLTIVRPTLVRMEPLARTNGMVSSVSVLMDTLDTDVKLTFATGTHV